MNHPTHTTAQAISLPAWERLRRAPGEARELGRFRRVVDLLLGDEIVALTTPDVGCGPFHLVVDALPAAPLPDNVALQVLPGALWIGPWRIALSAKLPLWNPRPAWESLTCSADGLAALHACTVQHIGADSASPFAVWLRGAATSPLGAGEALADLAGRGPGLTPSGDDFLAGYMLALWSRRGGAAAAPCAALYAEVAPRTHRLSRAFLAAARDGFADARWQRLLAALAGDDFQAVREATAAVLAFGATSGVDMVCGFLWGLTGAG